MPQLKDLFIQFIALSQGTWESVFEALRRSGTLKDFGLGGDPEILSHRGGLNFHDDYHYDEVADSIEQYVISGGRHPCLEPEQPDSQSELYLDDLGRDFDPVTPEYDSEDEWSDVTPDFDAESSEPWDSSEIGDISDGEEDFQIEGERLTDANSAA